MLYIAQMLTALLVPKAHDSFRRLDGLSCYSCEQSENNMTWHHTAEAHSQSASASVKGLSPHPPLWSPMALIPTSEDGACR